MSDVVILGDINVDIIARFDLYPAEGQDALASAADLHCGGCGANVAIALAGMGFKVILIARVGIDALGTKALDGLHDAGVIATGLQHDPAVMTGLMYVVVTSGGERTMLGHRGANAFTDPDQIREQDLAGARVFYLSGYALLTDPQRRAALQALELACCHGLTVVLDPGMCVPRAALDEMRSLFPLVDILLPNLAEARHLTGLTPPEDCARAILEAGVRAVALKLGREGCLIGNKEGLTHVPGFAVEARDTTGAGDHFAAGVIAGLLGGLDGCSAAVLGNALGAMAAARVGAGISVPRAQEVLALLADPCQEFAQGERVATVRRAADYVLKLATKPEEGGRLWWK
jgi:sugar/nucleoside kinase (ribokinase family)